MNTRFLNNLGHITKILCGLSVVISFISYFLFWGGDDGPIALTVNLAQSEIFDSVMNPPINTSCTCVYGNVSCSLRVISYSQLLRR